LIRAFAITRDEAHLEAAQSIAQFMRESLPRIPAEDGTYCFAYTPTDRRCVHNANLLVVEHLLRTGMLSGDASLTDAAAPGLAFSLNRQREDGSWPYGEYAEGEPFEAKLMQLVDNHHTGFVLRSLHAIHSVRQDETLHEAIRKGFRYYHKLFLPNGMPITAYGQYPVDIHACAEGILCNAILSENMPGARTLAIKTMRWSWSSMRDPRSGAPYHRKYPYHTARIVFPRWSVAWMYWALAEYVGMFKQK
jgi:polysaccharide biosynthesis protein VpsJ